MNLKFVNLKGGNLDLYRGGNIIGWVGPTLHVTETRGTVHYFHYFGHCRKYCATKRAAKKALIRLVNEAL